MEIDPEIVHASSQKARFSTRNQIIWAKFLGLFIIIMFLISILKNLLPLILMIFVVGIVLKQSLGSKY